MWESRMKTVTVFNVKMVTKLSNWDTGGTLKFQSKSCIRSDVIV